MAVALIEPPRYGWSPSNRWNRLVARLREDRGVGLVELLIALLVLNIGIFATLAAFTSGTLAIRRASHVSTAAAIADQEMEKLRNLPYSSLTSQAQPATPWPAAQTPDGRQYTVQVDITPNVSTAGSATVTEATVWVRDVKDGNKVLVESGSTFSQCAQNMTNASCGG